MAFVCKNCGSERIRTVENISGACGIEGIHTQPDGSLSYDFDGLGTEVFWDTSNTVGYDCADCLWETPKLENLVVEQT